MRLIHERHTTPCAPLHHCFHGTDQLHTACRRKSSLADTESRTSGPITPGVEGPFTRVWEEDVLALILHTPWQIEAVPFAPYAA